MLPPGVMDAHTLPELGAYAEELSDNPTIRITSVNGVAVDARAPRGTDGGGL
jgi:hypothetical protein